MISVDQLTQDAYEMYVREYVYQQNARGKPGTYASLYPWEDLPHAQRAAWRSAVMHVLEQARGAL